MRDVELVTKCLEKFWQDEFEIVGEDVARKIADDTLNGRGLRSKPSAGGDNFDLEGSLSILFTAAALVVGMLAFYYVVRANSKQERLQQLQQMGEELEGKKQPVKEIAATIVTLKEGDAGSEHEHPLADAPIQSVPDKSFIASPQPYETVTVELTIDHDFDLFSAEEKARVLHTLRELLDLPDEISIVAIEPGSTKLTITLTPEQAEQLLWLYECGVLDELNIKDAKIIGSAAANAIVRNKSQSNSYDVFMCHNSMDKPEVKQIALRLRSRGILPWLDEWELCPGLPWQQALEEQIQTIKSAAVFVGNSGIGPWQDMEMNALIRQFVQRQCPVIPVILKMCPCVPTLPSFLNGMTWVNFKKGKPNPYDQLIWGVAGKKL